MNQKQLDRTITFRLSEPYYKILVEMALSKDRSVSWMVRKIISNEL